jgi:transposase
VSPQEGLLASGSVEGINTKAKVALRISYGIRTDKVYETVLYHELERGPEHNLAHRFW